MNKFYSLGHQCLFLCELYKSHLEKEVTIVTYDVTDMVESTSHEVI
jgi:hypothetical protein